MATIDVDFDVFKSLTQKRRTESHTYNDVLRDLLGLPPVQGDISRPRVMLGGGCTMKGVMFPDGTQFRVTYKGRQYTAEIRDGSWIGSDGIRRNSPSEAAHAITSNNVNGWRFWEAKRPSDTDWRVMDQLR